MKTNVFEDMVSNLIWFTRYVLDVSVVLDLFVLNPD